MPLMNEKDAWNAFVLTGSVQDYLRYKSVQSENRLTNSTQTQNEDINGRTDNQTTEYR